MQARNRQNLQSKTHQHDRLIYVRQGATYSKLTCSLPGCSHSCFRTCSQASHSAPTSWTKIVAHTHKHRETKQSKAKQNKQTDGSGEVANKQQELKTKRLKNDALENPMRAMELGSIYRNREAKKTRWWRPRSPLQESWDTLRYLVHSHPCPCCNTRTL